VKKFGRSYKCILVGTRCSASVLGLSSGTRRSASLPLKFFTAPSGLGLVVKSESGPTPAAFGRHPSREGIFLGEVRSL